MRKFKIIKLEFFKLFFLSIFNAGFEIFEEKKLSGMRRIITFLVFVLRLCEDSFEGELGVWVL
jgi:hypothetical protein